MDIKTKKLRIAKIEVEKLFGVYDFRKAVLLEVFLILILQIDKTNTIFHVVKCVVLYSHNCCHY